jgi:hypothetical protein
MAASDGRSAGWSACANHGARPDDGVSVIDLSWSAAPTQTRAEQRTQP